MANVLHHFPFPSPSPKRAHKNRPQAFAIPPPSPKPIHKILPEAFCFPPPSPKPTHKIQPKALQPFPPPSPKPVHKILPRALQQLWALHRDQGINVLAFLIRQGDLGHLKQALHQGVLHRIALQELKESIALTTSRQGQQLHKKTIQPQTDHLVGNANQIKPQKSDVEFHKQISEASISAESEKDDSLVYSAKPLDRDSSRTVENEDWEKETTFESMMAEWQSDYGKKTWAELCEDLDETEQFETELNIRAQSAKAKKCKNVKKDAKLSLELKRPPIKQKAKSSTQHESRISGKMVDSPGKHEMLVAGRTARTPQHRPRPASTPVGSETQNVSSPSTPETGRRNMRPQKQGRKLFVKNVSFKVMHELTLLKQYI